MIVEVPLPLSAMPAAASPDALRAALTDFYGTSPIVVMGAAPESGEMLLRASAAGEDRPALFVFANADGTQARLVARPDPMGTGAGGACVKDLNIMAGLPDTGGLQMSNLGPRVTGITT